MNPQLVLSRDNTFRLTINYCAGMKTFTGIFTENESSIELVTDGFTFDDNDQVHLLSQ